MPSVPTKVRIEKQAMFEASLANAEKLLNMGMHSQAILEYGTIMERLLKALYTKYLPNLPIENKEKMVNYEKEIKAPINKFTLGQWIGLFQRADLFRYIAQEKKAENKQLMFFVPAILNTLVELRNKSAHSAGEDTLYVNKDSALFVRSAIVCILHELKE
jgi:hypothetical protein